MSDFDELDETIEDDDLFIHDPHLDFDFAAETICLDCGDLGSVDGCQCCGGPLCHQCYEGGAGFCCQCLKSPNFGERMAERMAELFGPEVSA